MSAKFNLIKNFLSRVFVLYLLTALILWIAADVRGAAEHAKFTTLSRYIPNPEEMEIFRKDWRKLSKAQFRDFEHYYEKIALFMPRLADAEGMKGFCYYYRGEKKKAQKAYTQASQMNPDLFNFHYNLGIIALDQKDYEKAFKHFQDSVATDPLANVRAITSSVIYITFLPSLNDPGRLAYEVSVHARDEYRRGYLQTLWTCDLTGNYRAMSVYARKALSNNFLDQGPFYYYAGLAAYHNGEYENAVSFLQDAIANKFRYAQVYHAMGLALRALGRRESDAAFLAAVRMAQEEKIYQPEAENRDLLIY